MVLPLLDHFHPPLKGRRAWESFHGRWAAALADSLDEGLLPREYFAEMQTHVGSRVEIDVPSFERDPGGGDGRAGRGGYGGSDIPRVCPSGCGGRRAGRVSG